MKSTLLKATSLLLMMAVSVLAQNIPPQFEKPIIDSQKQVKAEVHQTGQWRLQVGPSGAAATFTVTAESSASNGGKLTFDLATELDKLPSQKLTVGWAVKLVPPAGVSESMTDSATVSAPTVVTELAPSFGGIVTPSTKKVKVTVHQFGTWTLTAKPLSGMEFSVTALASSDNKGAISFDLTDKINELKPPSLAIGTTLTLKPPATLSAAQQAALTIATTARSSEVRITVNPVREGDDVITGTVSGTADRVRANVLSPTGFAVDNTDEDAVTGGRFSLGLRRHVAEGYTVRVVALQDGEEVGTFNYTSVIPVTFNWGRVRAYFSAGLTVASKDEAPVTQVADGVTTTTQERKFSSVDYFIGLNVDYNWLTTLKDQPAISCERPAGLVEDLLQLRRLVEDWGLADFDRLPDWGQAAGIASGTLSGMSGALGVIGDRINSSFGENCTNAEKLRATLLKSYAESTQPHVRDLNFLSTRYSALFEKFSMDLRAIDVGKARPALVELRRKSLTIQEYATQLDRISGPSDPLTKQAQDLLMLQEEIKLRITEADGYVKGLETAILQFQRSDPSILTGGHLLNSSFEGRLAQAPIAGPTSSISEGAADIVQHPNTGYVAADVYAPLWSPKMAWKNESSENALFLAPIFKAGMVMANSGPVTIPAAPVGPQLFRHVMPFWSAGVRLGHFALSGKRRSVAPELVSFLDLNYGRFDNFRQPKNNPTGVLPTPRDYIAKRFEVHGRLRVPETPLYVGFTGNFGPGSDDLRFFFGTRFDFTKAMGKLLARR